MAKIKVNKHDYTRVLLTETLPYEVPIVFSNEGFYRYVRDEDNALQTVRDFLKFFFKFEKYTTPYEYRITKNSKSKRLLSIPHPAVQLSFCDFYEDYDSIMTDLCKKSPSSLRAPAKVASRYYEKELADFNSVKSESVETEGEAFDKGAVYASSYFTYRKYNFLYKYYDSYESHRIEKKFESLTRFDISKCFHNIYVPTLSWCVKGKSFSKKHSGSYSFESRFQELMKNSNEQESSGILVGPEFSRIFSEIILQKIDLEIIDRLRNEYGLIYDKDYTFRRYVDDYFLYTKDDKTPAKILLVVVDELEKRKLFINESKTQYFEVPFITGLTIAKMEAKDLVHSAFEKFFVEGHSDIQDASFLNFNGSPSRESNRLIKEVKKLVKTNDVNYESLSGYLLSEIRRYLFKVIQDSRVICSLEDSAPPSILKYILMIVEVSFFIYSMDMRVRTTYIITQMIVFLNRLSALGDAEFRDEISKKIYDESTLLLEKMSDKGKANSIETLNLLIGISTNTEKYPLDNGLLFSLFGLSVSDDGSIAVNELNGLGYFQLMVLSYFCKDRYSEVNSFLERYILEKVKCNPDIVIKTEMVLLFLDSIRNPYFSDDFKEELLQAVVSHIGCSFSPSQVEQVLSYIKRRDWFFTWESAMLENVLMKKELRSPY